MTVNDKRATKQHAWRKRNESKSKVETTHTHSTKKISKMSSSESESESKEEIQEDDDDASSPASFIELGLVDTLQEACLRMGWKKPTKIQAEVIPVALEGKDIIGLAETGSGKTGAFALPILQALLEANGPRLFALVLTPTRELAYQIAEQFDKLGGGFGVKTATLVGELSLLPRHVMSAEITLDFPTQAGWTWWTRPWRWGRART